MGNSSSQPQIEISENNSSPNSSQAEAPQAPTMAPKLSAKGKRKPSRSPSPIPSVKPQPSRKRARNDTDISAHAYTSNDPNDMNDADANKNRPTKANAKKPKLSSFATAAVAAALPATANSAVDEDEANVNSSVPGTSEPTAKKHRGIKSGSKIRPLELPLDPQPVSKELDDVDMTQMAGDDGAVSTAEKKPTKPTKPTKRAKKSSLSAEIVEKSDDDADMNEAPQKSLARRSSGRTQAQSKSAQESAANNNSKNEADEDSDFEGVASSKKAKYRPSSMRKKYGCPDPGCGKQYDRQQRVDVHVAKAHPGFNATSNTTGNTATASKSAQSTRTKSTSAVSKSARTSPQQSHTSNAAGDDEKAANDEEDTNFTVGPWSNKEKKRAATAFEEACSADDIEANDLKEAIQNWSGPELATFKALLKEKTPQRSDRSRREFCKRFFFEGVTGAWTPAEDEVLRQFHATTPGQWIGAAQQLGRKPDDCANRYNKILAHGSTRRTGPWTKAEIELLRQAVETVTAQLKASEDAPTAIKDAKLHEMVEVINWNAVAASMDFMRSPDGCRDKYKKLLSKGTLSNEVDDTLLAPADEEELAEKFIASRALSRAAKDVESKFGTGDRYECLHEIVTAVASDAEYDAETTFWAVVAANNPDSLYMSAHRRAVFYSGILHYKSERLKSAANNQAKAKVMMKKIQKYANRHDNGELKYLFDPDADVTESGGEDVAHGLVDGNANGDENDDAPMPDANGISEDYATPNDENEEDVDKHDYDYNEANDEEFDEDHEGLDDSHRGDDDSDAVDYETPIGDGVDAKDDDQETDSSDEEMVDAEDIEKALTISGAAHRASSTDVSDAGSDDDSDLQDEDLSANTAPKKTAPDPTSIMPPPAQKKPVREVIKDYNDTTDASDEDEDDDDEDSKEDEITKTMKGRMAMKGKK